MCGKLYCLALNYKLSEMYSLETFHHCTFNMYIHILKYNVYTLYTQNNTMLTIIQSQRYSLIVKYSKHQCAQ